MTLARLFPPGTKVCGMGIPLYIPFDLASHVSILCCHVILCYLLYVRFYSAFIPMPSL